MRRLLARQSVGDGTMGNPWQITSVTELQELAESVNSGNARAGEYFLLTADLDLSGVCGANLNGQEVGWTPIGCAGDITFCGVFDGAGHTVSNLYICEGENYRGLFGTVSGTVKNLNVTGNVLASATFDSYIGGVAGASYGAVESCTFSGKVSGRNYVGGVVGYTGTDCIVRNCRTLAGTAVEGTGSGVGGVVGDATNGTVLKNCVNNGAVSGKTYVGGVAGTHADQSRSGYSVTGCTNGSGAKVSGNSRVGGIVGEPAKSLVENCVNRGTVSGSKDYVGGITGYLSDDCMVRNCANERTGKVTAASYCGGIVGAVDNARGALAVEECRNSGTVGSVTAEGYEAGGIVGQASGPSKIENCYNTGKIVSYENAGGIAGKLSVGAHLWYCFNWSDPNPDTTAVAGNAFKLVGNVGDNEVKTGHLHNCFFSNIKGSANATFWNYTSRSKSGEWTWLSEGNMSDASNFTAQGWDFNNVWIISSTQKFHGAKNGPILRFENENQINVTPSPIVPDEPVMPTDPHVDPSTPRPDDPVPRTVIITSAAELGALRDAVNGGDDHKNATVLLCADIDLANAAWTAIGNGNKCFNGTFDGQGHAITGLNANVIPTTGLFGTVGEKGTVRNLAVCGAVSSGTNSGSIYAGGVAGTASGGVTNCYALTGSAAALIGNNSGATVSGGFVPETDFAKQTSFAGFDFTGVWGMGEQYPLLRSLSEAVTLDPNGGTGEVRTILCLKGEGLTLPACTYSRNGYVFAGWNTRADGNGVAYVDRATVRGGTKLYASWIKGSPYYDYIPLSVTPGFTGLAGEEYARLFDAGSGALTKWRVMSSGVQSGQAFSVEFATPQYICPCGYVLVTADDTQQYPDSKPRNWTLEAKNSQDGDWVVLARVSDDTSLPSANCAPLSMPIANVQEYCYFRLTFNGVGGGDTFQLSDFYLLISGGARDCTITFDPQGGGAIADGNARNRENMALAAAPVRMGYDFLGWNTAWDGGGTRYAAGAEYFATGDATLYAEWEAQTREVRWLNWNGAQLAASSVKTGRMPVYTGPAPTKPPENMLKAYEFSGWSPEVKAVSGTDSVITYTAQFREVVRTFTVTWKNYDGTVLETDRRVAYGTATSYESMTPVKTSTAAQDFTFSSWSPVVSKVVGDTTYTAYFDGYHNVIFDGDGGAEPSGQMKAAQVVNNGSYTLPENHFVKANFQFDAWSIGGSVYAIGADVTPITMNITVKALWKQLYTVTWKDSDGTVLKTEQVADGGIPASWTPVKPEDARASYTFTGWLPAPLSPVTGDVTYTAQFNETAKRYDVTWKNESAVLETDRVLHGETASYDGATPVRQNDAVASYRFFGWSQRLAPVTRNMVYTALFTAHALPTPIPAPNPLPGQRTGSAGSTQDDGGEKPELLSQRIQSPLILPGGKILVDPSTAVEGRTITLTAAPDEGYGLASLTVRRENGKAVNLNAKGNGVYTFVMPGGRVEIQAEFRKNFDTGDVLAQFTDLKPDAWYIGYVRWAVERDIMHGMGGGIFAPGGTTSRAMIAQMLFNLDGAEPSGNTAAFSDVDAASWYAPAVTWAAERGIVNGYGKRFGANDPVTREQLAVMLYNYARYKGCDVSAAGEFGNFPDSGDVSAWAQRALAWAVGTGIIGGTKNADGSITLDAQGVATMFQRFCETVVK